MSKASTKPASGMRDFLPREARHRRHVFALVEEVYQSYGFDPLDTPCVERLTTLMGKYGEEGDQLIFKILKRGNKLDSALAQPNPGETDIADHGLRYDLTVPLARVYAQYPNEFPRIFKRYQIAPVWRADRPQKGRYREFYQCDVDVVGSDSMLVEAEVTSALSEILERLEFGNFRIHVNHRKLLLALMEVAGIPDDKETDALVAIDKLDKIGHDGVVAELQERGIAESSIDKLMGILGAQPVPTDENHDNVNMLSHLREALGGTERGVEALDELEQLLAFAAPTRSAPYLKIDPYLARGLSYYTGPIFEIRSDDFAGSVGGGGRYDGLIGMFSGQDVPACGFSLGIERILFLLEERSDKTEDSTRAADMLVTVWNDALAPKSVALVHELREAGFRADLYMANDKFGKQFGYADDRNIPFTCVLAPDEVEKGIVQVKAMKSGEQHEVPRDEIVAWFSAIDTLK